MGAPGVGAGRRGRSGLLADPSGREGPGAQQLPHPGAVLGVEIRIQVRVDDRLLLRVVVLEQGEQLPAGGLEPLGAGGGVLEVGGEGVHAAPQLAVLAPHHHQRHYQRAGRQAREDDLLLEVDVAAQRLHRSSQRCGAAAGLRLRRGEVRLDAGVDLVVLAGEHLGEGCAARSTVRALHIVSSRPGVPRVRRRQRSELRAYSCTWADLRGRKPVHFIPLRGIGSSLHGSRREDSRCAPRGSPAAPPCSPRAQPFSWPPARAVTRTRTPPPRPPRRSTIPVAPSRTPTPSTIPTAVRRPPASPRPRTPPTPWAARCSSGQTTCRGWTAPQRRSPAPSRPPPTR